MARLLLIDGSNYLFRAYHALPALTTSQGHPTGALKGFLGMLSKVRDISQADKAVVVFDTPGPTFRHEMFPEYKAQRPPMPEDLRVQIEPLQTVIRQLGWPLLLVPGIEADDVIGSLAHMATQAGHQVVIASGDKDLSQLVDENVVVLNTMNNKFYDIEGVKAKYGIEPRQMIDYLALMGDKVDNVPGIKGCGEKTAAKWLNEYGSIEGICEAAPTMKGKIGENLRAGLPFLEVARQLVTVKCDAAIDGIASFDDIVFHKPDSQALTAFSKTFEISLNSVLRALPPGVSLSGDVASMQVSHADTAPEVRGSATPEEGPLDVLSLMAPHKIDDTPYTVIDSEATLAQLTQKLEAPRHSPVAVSLLFEGSDYAAQIRGIAFALTPLDIYVALDHDSAVSMTQVLNATQAWLSGEAPKVMHDAKTKLHALKSRSITVGGIVDDTMLMHYVLASHLSHDLSILAPKYLARALPPLKEQVDAKTYKLGLGHLDATLVRQYLADEAAVIRALHAIFSRDLKRQDSLGALYETLERPLMRVLFEMEEAGVVVNTKKLHDESVRLAKSLTDLEAKAHALAGQAFNLASPKQLGSILFESLQLPVIKKTSTGAPSTDEEVLSQLALDYPLPKIVLEWRRLSKLKTTYLDKLPKLVHSMDGRIHTTFGQATAVTGRLTSLEPNLQNIPTRSAEGQEIRRAFEAQPGWVLVDADYSQVELRIMAHLSKDANLLRAFESGEDVHRSTASEVFGTPLDQVTPEERRLAKVINFGLIYGMSAFGLAQQMGLDRKVAESYVNHYFERFPGVKRFMEATRSQAHELGYVETVLGRRLAIPDITSSRRTAVQAAERAAINAPMQGSAADFIKRAMLAVATWLRQEGLRSRLILQVHDELVVETHPDELARIEAMLPKLMQEVASLAVPLIAQVGVGPTWADAH